MYNLKGLYSITSEKLNRNMVADVAQVIAGGASVVQYRNKNLSPKKQLRQAQDLQALCKSHNVPLIINDNVELAKTINAGGVHLGKDDCKIKPARNVLGANTIIGVSCYNQINLAIEAEQNGANYVAFGSFFSSNTRPNAVKAHLNLLITAKQRLSIPVVAIGGVNSENCQALITAGADMVAVIEAVFASNSVDKAARQISEQFNID